MVWERQVKQRGGLGKTSEAMWWSGNETSEAMWWSGNETSEATWWSGYETRVVTKCGWLFS